MNLLCRCISFIFSPLLVPTWAMILVARVSILTLLPANYIWCAICVIFLLTCILPLSTFLLLYKRGLISTPSLNNRTDRTIPYIITIFCYCICAWMMVRARTPLWLPMFFIGASAATAVNTIVNLWWKISGHAAAMGGLTAMTFLIALYHLEITDMYPWISAAIILTGMVMSARVYLQRHTLMQVFLGVANGFLCIWISSFLI